MEAIKGKKTCKGIGGYMDANRIMWGTMRGKKRLEALNLWTNGKYGQEDWINNFMSSSSQPPVSH